MNLLKTHRIMIITRSVLLQKTLIGHVKRTKILQEIGSTQWIEQGLVRFYTASVIQPNTPFLEPFIKIVRGCSISFSNKPLS